MASPFQADQRARSTSMDGSVIKTWTFFQGLNVSVLVAFLGILATFNYVQRKWKIKCAKAKIEEKLQFVRQNRGKIEDDLFLVEQESVGVWNEIFSLSFESLQGKLKNGKIKAVDAVQAYQKAALEVNDKVNCVVHFIEDAVQEAQLKDKLPAKERGPLHGIPVSVKDCFFVKQCDATNGMVQYILNPCNSDAVSVQLLREMGAIPFCITNVPQALISLQCSNPVFGSTGNPHNHDKECGGSSGGEGALIGGGGSVLGIGNDIGGSLRCPAAFCGTYSLKPTNGRHISNEGGRDLLPYPLLRLKISSGFLSSSVTGLVEGYKAMWNNKSLYRLDQEMVPVSWRSDIYSSKRMLKVGYSVENGLFEYHPAIKRAVLEAKQLLEAAGHEVLPFDLPDSIKCAKLYCGIVYQDNFAGLLKAFDKDVLVDSANNGVVAYAYLLRFLPKWVIQVVINGFLSFVTKLQIYPSFDSVSLLERKAGELDKFRRDYVAKLNEQGIDLLLVPGSLFPAPYKGLTGKIPCAISAYTTWNLLDFPAGIVPITNVSTEDEENFETEFPQNDMIYRAIKVGCKDSFGLPSCVQVVGRRFEEENVLRLMKELENLSSFKVLKIK